MKKIMGKIIVVVLVIIAITILSYSCYKTIFDKDYVLENIEPVDLSTEE